MKILLVEKCNECRNRVLIEETSWRNGIMTKIGKSQCAELTELKNKYGRTIETFPDIPKWCPLEDCKNENSNN